VAPGSCLEADAGRGSGNELDDDLVAGEGVLRRLIDVVRQVDRTTPASVTGPTGSRGNQRRGDVMIAGELVQSQEILRSFLAIALRPRRGVPATTP